MKKRVITVASNKGGVGKTTTVVNLAAGLALSNRRVLVIDTDPQANSTYALLGQKIAEQTLYDVLIGSVSSLYDVIMKTGTPGIELIPSSITLSAADITLAGIPGREKLLSRRRKTIEEYDYILLDPPPSLGVLTVNSLTSASEVFIPVSIGTFALMGIKLLEDTISQLKENLELNELKVAGAIATLSDHTRIANDTLEALRSHFGERLFKSIIPRNKDIEEAHSRAQSIFAYAPESKGGLAYKALTEEVISHEH